MTTLQHVTELIEEEKWEELDIAFSSLSSSDIDLYINNNFLNLFKNYIPEAIILTEKHSFVGQYEILFLLKFSPSTTRKNLIKNLLDSNTIKPLKFFEPLKDEKNFNHLNLISENILHSILTYFNENQIKNIYDNEFLKTIFSNKEIEKIIDKNQHLFKFILKLSNLNDFFLLNNYVEKENFIFLDLITSHLKNNIQNLDNDLFLKNTSVSFLDLKKKLKHPFSSKSKKENIQIILEELEKINLFLDLNNKTFENNKKNKHKI